MSLEWRDVGHSHNGYVGKVRLFSVQWGVVRNDDKPYVLHCELPGYSGKRWACVDHADAERKAAEIWRRWRVAVGVVSDGGAP